MAEPLRVGIIGANWTLKVHRAAWQLVEDVEVVAVCTAHQETAKAAAAQSGLPKAYWNIADMAADPEIDIIDVGSRPAFRKAMVMSSLAGGKHVYDALPFAVSTGDAFEMSNEAAARGRIGVVDAQFRWVPAAQHMKSLIDEGYIGKPLGFNVQLLMPLVRNREGAYPYSAWPGQGMSPYLWLAEPESGGGGWRNFGSHSLLLLCHLLGDEVAEVCGAMDIGVKTWNMPDGSVIIPRTEDLGTVLVRLANGASGVVQTGWSVPDAAALRVEVWGDAGRLLLVDPSFGDGVSARLYAGRADLADRTFGDEAAAKMNTGDWTDIPERYFEVPGTNFSKETALPYKVSMGWMFHHMVRAIRLGGTGSPSFEEAAKVHRAIEAAVTSARERRWIRVDEQR